MSQLNKHQVTLDDSLYLHIRRGVKTIYANNIFGEDDLMKGRRVRTTSAIANTAWWVIEIKKQVYNGKIKECVKKMKEVNAVFLHDWISRFDKKIIYERVKDFFLNDFNEIELPKNSTILNQNEKSNEMFIVKQGVFSLVKTINLSDPFYDKRCKL